MKIEGAATYVDSNGKRHSIEGIGSLPDDTSLQSLNVAGSFSFDDISCDKVKIEGDGRGKSIVAKNISVSGSVEIDSIKVEELFQVSGSTEISNLSAEEIIMESRGGTIGKIKCDKIKIFHSGGVSIDSNTIFSKIFGSHTSHVKTDSRVHINKLDAVKVELQNCEVGEIKCKDAYIGSNCVIQKLIVEGECEVAADSKVEETIRN